MSAVDPSDSYALGRSAAETLRLIRQAQIYGPITRQFLVSAGIGTGMKVLDVGSGAGDVALLLADLVGPRGSVVGVEMNPVILETARARVDAVGWTNVTFLDGDVTSIALDDDFDAVVGRWILMYLPDPVAVLRGLLGRVRSGASSRFRRTTSPTHRQPIHRHPCTSRSCDGRRPHPAAVDRISRWARNCIRLISTPGCRTRSYASTHLWAAGSTGQATPTWQTPCAVCSRCWSRWAWQGPKTWTSRRSRIGCARKR
jgi:SAM-dependent methyltransferase